MKKTGIMFVMIFFSSQIGIVSAQTAPVTSSDKRIQFEKGQTSAKVEGTTGENGVTYVVGAKSGQKLVLTLVSPAKVGIKVETVGSYGPMTLLSEEKAGTYEVGLEESGDSTIFIGSLDHKSASFTLVVKIDKLKDI